MNPQQFVPGHREKRLYPLAFCRETGKDYFSVWMEKHPDGPVFRARSTYERDGEEDQTAGYLYLSAEHPWNFNESSPEFFARITDDWIATDKNDRESVNKDKRDLLPRQFQILPDGTTGANSIEVAFFEAPICAAVKHVDGIEHENITHAVFDALGLPLSGYASNPRPNKSAMDEIRRALKEVLSYRIYVDLRRGWRISSPNLEQCGLLQIQYRNLEEICADTGTWQGTASHLLNLSPEVRHRLSKTLLDHLRRELAIEINFLEAEYQQRVRQLSSQRLKAPWAQDGNEKLTTAFIAKPRSQQAGDTRDSIYVSARDRFAYEQFFTTATRGKEPYDF
jgi:hypothetical protein